MWKAILFKRRTPEVTASVVQKASAEFRAIVNYKFSEKIKYLKP